MKLNTIKINNKTFKLYFKKDVFIPTATSNFLVSSFLKFNKKVKNKKILDLGCGSGVIAIAISEILKNNKYYASDLSKNSIICCKKNFSKFNIVGEVKKGSMYEPWSNYKFNYIINDISGISSTIAKKSKWFKYVPSSSGTDGTKLTIKIINDSCRYLDKNGKMYLPLISLSNTKKVLKFAKKKFNKVKTVSENKWFLPNDLERYKNLLFEMKKKKQINFEYKFGKFICYTNIIELRN